MALGVPAQVVVLYLFSLVPFSFYRGIWPVAEASVRPLTSFQRFSAKYAFQCTTAQCQRRQVTSIGKPVVWKYWSSYLYANWMVDPTKLCAGIYLMPSYTSIRYVYKYTSMANAKANKAASYVTLPSPGAQGTGATVYSGSLYYNQQSTNKLVRFDLSKKRVAASRSLSDAYYSGAGSYGWGGYTGIDFAVSETGLYVIYASKRRGARLTVARLNPKTLAVETTFYLNVKKKGLGNCFIVCATLYCTSSYSGSTATVSIMYDLHKNLRFYKPKITFRNIYSYNYMLSYNPEDQTLYAWNYYRMVTYRVNFKGGH